MVGFLFKRFRKSKTENRVIDPYQRQLNGFHNLQQDRKATLGPRVSISQIEDEVKENLKAFQSYIEGIKETSLKLEELRKMLRSGEISENVYKLISDKLGEQLSVSLEEIFKLREALELAQAKGKLELAGEKMAAGESERTGSRGARSKETYVADLQEQKIARALTRSSVYYPSVYRWEEIVSKIDAAISSMTIEEEASIIEQYLSLINERISPESGSEKAERGKALCRQRLNSISEKWASIRREKIEKLMNIEIRSSQTKNEIEELELRFAVGELDQRSYEYKMNTLQVRLKEVETEISNIRDTMDEVDMRIFRCSELLREDS
ncbi:MAG: hypothetical protein OEZ48_06620 [Candidatus Bathyarchaeota archaeon]|nr:hypothetical protein [Candidatus Bathyarchaeota archaeon]